MTTCRHIWKHNESKNSNMEISELYDIFRQHPVVTTDTRQCVEGSIFFALKGASFNGNDFALNALKQGCSYAVTDETRAEWTQEANADTAKRIIRVENVLLALQQLARHHRRQLGTRIIGVTGTNGKTTTKELIAAVLSEKYNVLYTQGNLNNHIGVPMTLLRLNASHDIAVIEMGANHPGEIKTLVEIVEPDCGIITNVGRAHLGGFGSFEGVVKTKGELYDFLRKSHATVFIDADNPHLNNIAHGLSLVRYTAQGADDAAIEGTVVECKPFLTFDWRRNGGETHRVETHLIGDYNIKNMLAAATIGAHMDVSDKDICHALQNYIPSNNRSQLTVTQRNRLIVDAYNANPTSMAAALHNFANMQVENKMMILGSMAELGDVSKEEHRKVVDYIKASGITDVWLVGEGFAETGHPFRQFNNIDEVKAEIAANDIHGKYILIKGSNSQKLFLLPELL